MLSKNTTGQGTFLVAYDTINSVFKTGDASNISGKYSLDGATQQSCATAHPTEIGGGLYWQPLAQAETNANQIGMSWTSVTSGIQIDPVILPTTAGIFPTAAAGAANGLPVLDGSAHLNVQDVAGKVLGGGSSTISGVGAQIDLQTIKGQTVTASSSGVTFPTSIGTSVYAGGAVASVTSAVTVGTNNDKNGYSLATAPPTTSQIAAAILTTPANLLATDSSGRVLLQPTQTGVTIPTVTTLTNAVTVTGKPAVALNATDVTGNLPANVIQWNTSSPPTFASTVAIDMTTTVPSSPSAGTVGSAFKSMSSIADPLATTVPGSYSAGTAGYLLGTYLDAKVSTKKAVSLAAADVTGNLPVDLQTIKTQAVTASAGVTFPASIGTSVYAGGAVASVTAAVTVGTNNDKNGYGLATAPPTTSQIAAAILATPANLISTDSNGRVLLQPTQTGVTIPTVTTVTNAVTAGTVSDKSGYSLATAPPTSSTIAAAVWDQSTTGHTTGGSFGSAMNAAGSLGDPWATTLPGSYSAGSAGYLLSHKPSVTLASTDVTGNLPVDLQTIKTQAVTAAAGVTFPSSIGTSVYAGGAVASVTNPVTVGTNNDKTGYGLVATPPTLSQIAAAILATPANLLVTDSAGRILLQPTQTGVTIPTVSTITNAVTVTGKPAVSLSASDVSGNVAANITQIAGQTATAASPVTFPGAIGTSTVNAGDAMSLTSMERTATATALLDLTNAVETGESVRNVLRMIRAMAAGITTTSSNNQIVTFIRKDGTTAAFTITHDQNGNRTLSQIGTV